MTLLYRRVMRNKDLYKKHSVLLFGINFYFYYYLSEPWFPYLFLYAGQFFLLGRSDFILSAYRKDIDKIMELRKSIQDKMDKYKEFRRAVPPPSEAEDGVDQRIYEYFGAL